MSGISWGVILNASSFGARTTWVRLTPLRTQREFIRQLGAQNGLVIEWRRISGEEMMEASNHPPSPARYPKGDALFPMSIQRPLDHLPAIEAQWLYAEPRTILTWGDGPAEQSADCLIAPGGISAEHLRSCRYLYISVVPAHLAPVPGHLGDFTLLSAAPVEGDLLAIYGSSAYLGQTGGRLHREQERQKWERYYEDLAPEEVSEVTASFNNELRDRILELLPQGGRILEAGCGGGWQSLALAQTGKFDLTVMDFSRNALNHARGVFDRAGAKADFRLEDVFAPGQREFDLVFNAGVLEHYTFEEQVRFVQSMAARSRRFVLVLVPNASCYWYWLWRIHHAAKGNWPFGKEVPARDLSAVMKAAGLHFAGQAYLGAEWTASFIASLQNLDPGLRSQINEIHNSGLIPAEQQAYLLAALATREPEGLAWQGGAGSSNNAELGAALADALALRIGGEARVVELERRLDRATEEAKNLEHIVRTLRNEAEAERRERAQSAAEERRRFAHLTAELRAAEELRSRTAYGLSEYSTVFENLLASLRPQRAWMIMLAIRKSYMLATRPGFGAKLGFLKWLIFLPFAGAGSMQGCDVVFPQIANYVPENLDTPIASGVPRTAEQTDSALPPGVPAQQRYDVVVLAIIDFDFRFQRPQQIAAQYARNGHRVIWISPTRFLPPGSKEAYQVHPLREGIWEIRLRGPQPDIYMGTLEDETAATLQASLDAVYRDFAIAENCALVQLPFWRKLGLALRRTNGAKLVYDCMDDWDTFQNMGKFNVTEERSLVHECDLLVVTAARLEQKYRAQNLRPLLVRNGADFDFFQKAEDNDLLRDVPKPVAGYFGAIADWIDLDLIYETARLRPQYSFVLIGQVFDRDVSTLEALPNVFLLGSKKYAEIPLYLRGFDVCIIPFLLNQVTQATDPVKLYEYFSQGKPVVATSMSELSQCGDLLYLADDGPAFAAKLDLALTEKDPELSVRRRAFAAANTWGKRVEALDAAISASYPLVSVLIICYNSAEFIGPCFESIRRNTSYPNYELIAIDNASSDNSPALLRERAAKDPRLHLTCSGRNLGFAGANNLAATQARGEYFVLLNADTMVTPGWLHRMIRPVVSDPSVGIVSAVTNFAGNEVKLNVDYQNEAGMENFALLLARDKRGQTMDIPMSPLFCSLVPRTIWEKAGPLDEGFGIGMFEDDDFSRRVRMSGYRVVAAEDCFVHHFGQGSFSKLASAEYNALFEKNRARYEEKWNVKWKPHSVRPNVRPAFEEKRFVPREFCTNRP